MEEDEVKKKIEHEIGENLDDVSVDELNLRIGLLENEIIRLQGSIKQKRQSQLKAEAMFKF
ncbi:MAG: DUF1192 domain-containing protein [Devosiaceae bacterium]|nr:DUF1192 domain-containing protein [Devosiaceae bacterium]